MENRRSPLSSRNFLHEIKNLGYDVKLDTNGSRPSVVKNLAAADLIDKVAMDIKTCPSNYHVLTGVAADLDAIRETAMWLLEGDLDYEFRTTVVRSFIQKKISWKSVSGYMMQRLIIFRLTGIPTEF